MVKAKLLISFYWILFCGVLLWFGLPCCKVLHFLIKQKGIHICVETREMQTFARMCTVFRLLNKMCVCLVVQLGWGKHSSHTLVPTKTVGQKTLTIR